MCDPALLKEYGALDISVASDLPLFVDPFLLFNSEDKTYQGLHNEILRYLRFLRDEAGSNGLDEATIEDLYCFKEVKQNWSGFTLFGNEGALALAATLLTPCMAPSAASSRSLATRRSPRARTWKSSV